MKVIDKVRLITTTVVVSTLLALVIGLGGFPRSAHSAVIQLDQAGCEQTANNVYQIALWRDKGIARADALKQVESQRAEAVKQGMNPKAADTYARFLSWIVNVVYDNPRVKPEELAVDFYAICIQAGGRVDMGEST